ncbi:MAG: hypothetical protein ACJ757_04825 [Gaiellaceae bacterium]
MDDNALSMHSVAAEGEAAYREQAHRDGRRFLSVLLLAEQELRAHKHGPTLTALVGELQQLAAETDGANLVMEENDDAALRFDAVVAAWKESR